MPAGIDSAAHDDQNQNHGHCNSNQTAASTAVPAATAIVVVVSATTTAAGRTAEVAVERRHVLGISCICLAILFVILGIGILLLRHLHRERQHNAPGKLGVPLVLHGFHGVPEDLPVCKSGRRMGRQHDLGMDKFFLLVVEFRFLVVLAEQPFAALVSGPGNSGLSLAALDDGNFEMRTWNRHHPLDNI